MNSTGRNVLTSQVHVQRSHSGSAAEDVRRKPPGSTSQTVSVRSPR
jgi:hypothetical protein